MNIFLLDKNLKIQDTLSSEGGVLTPPFFNDEYEQVLETGAETFTFETLPNKFLETGNYIAFMYNNEHKLFQISEIEEKHEEDYVVKVYCEFAGLELTYEILRPRKIPSANISQYLENVLSDTDWEVGNVDSTINGVFTIDIDSYDKVYSNIQENIKKYECEISFRVEMKNGRVTHKYIDVYKQRGRVTNYRFEYSKNMTNVTRTTNVFDLVTALVGIGKNDMTFKEAEWSKEKGDFADKPKNQDFIADEEAFAKYNNNGSHLMGYFKCDLESPYDILNATYKELQERKNPKVEYEVDVKLLDVENTELGDEIYVIDNDWQSEPLHLSARINNLIISFTDSSKNKCTMSNYKKVKSRIKDDVSALLNQINNSMFMGVSKGGFLNSNLAASNFDINVKNKMIDENGKEYFFDVRNKKASTFLDNIANTSVKVTQSFAIDFVNNHIYATQVEDDNTTGNIILSKIDFNGKVLGKMYLKAFGHGNQIGIDRIDGVTKIWVECDGAIASGGSFFGKKVCRFEFINNKTCYNHEGNVYALAPSDSEYVFVAVNEESDRLGIRYKQNGKFYFEVYSLRSVLNNTPQLLAKILRPSSIETSSKSPNQGFALHANMIYNYEGFSYEQTDNKNNIKISCIDFKGTVLYSQYITHAPNLSYREPEGLFFRQVDETIFELYFGITSGATGARKFNIYKFTDSVGEKYEKRGSFLHSNGHTSVVDEGIIRTGYTGATRKNAYLLYVNKKDRFIYEGDTSHQFVVAEFRNGKWYHREKEFEVDINDAIVGEIQEKKDGISLILFTQDFNAIKGQDGIDGADGLPGQDALFLELTNEFHSIPTDVNGNNGIYNGCETELNLYRGDIQLTNNVTYSVKSSENVTGNLVNNKYTVTSLTEDAGYVDLAANYLGNEYIKRFSLSKNKQGLGGEDGLTPTVYWLMTSTSTISKDSKGNLKPSSVTFWAKSQTGEENVVDYQGIFKIYESVDGNTFVLKHTSELDDTIPYIPSSTAQSIKCELYLNDGVTLIDQDIINIVKDGTDGFSGADAKYVLLTGEQLFKYTNNFTGTPTPSSITLTGTPYNISSVNSKWYYKKSSDSDYTLISSNNGKMDFTVNHEDNMLFANNNKVVTIKFDIDGYYDEMTIAKISDGSSGSDGEDGYFVLLTNENHTVPCENDGTVVNGELEKAKTEIHVFKGTKEVAFTLSKVDSGCTSVYNAANKTISITSLTSKSATVTLNIRVDNVDFTKVMSISKAIKGDTGAGVNIIGSLNSESDLPNFGNMGDAYIIGGFLYIWSGNTNTWENVGQIKGDQGIAGKPGADGITYYTWVKYADDENGSGMSDDPVDSNGIYKKYMGMAYNKETQQESSNPKDYIWIKVVGEDGHDSIVANLTNDAHAVPTDSNGANGNYSGCSTQIELFIGSEKVTSGVTYSFSPIGGITGSGNTSNGTYTVTNMTIDAGYVDLTARYNNKNFVKRFTISKNKQGQAGTNGTNGIDGRPGQDGVTYYTWIKYSNNANGNPMTDDPNSKYIGIAYNKPSIIEGTNPQDYTWTLIKGADGQDGTDGQDGIPGAPGEDGITYYTWIKYSNNADGSNMTDNPDSKYIGIAYNKLEKTESTNPRDYSWTLIKGEDGKDAYTINLTNDNHSFGCDSNGNIETSITTTTSVSAFKGANSITVTIGSLPTVAGLTLSKSGATVTIQANTGNLLADNGSFNIPIVVDGHSFTKSFSWVKTKKGTDGVSGEDGISVTSVDVEYAQNSSPTVAPTSGWTTTSPTWQNGKYIWSRTKTVLSTGKITYTNAVCIAGAKGDTGSAGKGVKSIVEQYYLSTSQTALSGGSWSTTVPTWQQGKYIWTRSVITYTDNTTTTTNGICVSGSKGDKGDAGSNGANGTSPVLVTISGQQSMKYLDKTTAPTPSTITLTANVMEGNVVVSSGMTYIWQYKNSSGTWVNLSGTYTSKTYSLAHNNTGFVNEVAQIRVAVSYKSKTYYLEHTVTKIYDNKYITHQEIFDKVTNNGQHQVLYKDPQTGEIYINATFIKSGQLVADLIKGGILTLGGAIGTDDNPVNGYMRVLGADNQELAVLNGGEMTINGLSSDEATIDSLFVQDIKSPKIPPAVTENTTIYVNQTTGNDDAEFDNGAVYKTVQGAIDATPKNLNGFDVYIRLQGTSSGGVSIYSENLTYKGFYGGSLYTYLQKNYIHGYIVMRDCSARLSLVGGSNYDEIPDGASESARANIKPASLYATGNTYYTICAINCTDVYIRALDLWGSTATNSNGYPNYAVGVREGSNVFVRNVKIHSSTNGFHAQVMGRLFAVNTYGKVTNYAYRCTYGGWMNIGSGNSVSGGSSSLNISTGDGCQILQGNVTWDGSSSTGTNDNTTVNSNTTTYNATSGDSWKVKYSSWRKDNTVRQGDWSGTGMHKGCWFFGSQFSSLKGKTIKSVKLTIQRQSSGGNSGAVAFTLKMHNHSSRPSGAPSYLSGWSKNVSLSLGQSSTVTITDSAVLTAIKNGTMKGFGIEVSSTSNSYYGILSPKLKAVVTYS